MGATPQRFRYIGSLLFLAVVFCVGRSNAAATDCLTRGYDEVLDGDCLTSSCAVACTDDPDGGSGPGVLLNKALPTDRNQDKNIAAWLVQDPRSCEFCSSASFSASFQIRNKRTRELKLRLNLENPLRRFSIRGLAPFDRGRA